MTLPMQVQLDIKQVSYSVRDQEKILADFSVQLGKGCFAGIIGPNGSGKTTLLRCVYGALKPKSGTIFLNTRDIRQMKPMELARSMAAVLQESPSDFDFTVEEMVMMGRHPHKKGLALKNLHDRELVQQALNRVGLADFQHRRFSSLSGGEKQRVRLARALVQEADLLILDEPTNHLDIRYAIEILSLVQSLGITVLAVLHDLNLAAAYCDVLYLVAQGKVVAYGKPEDILTPQRIQAVFGVGAFVAIHPLTHKPVITFFPASQTPFEEPNHAF
jgi:iron complex transport system ATP-binding protein